jgi:hypothetical protein
MALGAHFHRWWGMFKTIMNLLVFKCQFWTVKLIIFYMVIVDSYTRI